MFKELSNWIKFIFEKKIDHSINTDVWIGKTKLDKYDVLVEWYFLSDEWIELANSSGAIPVRKPKIPLMIKTFFSQPIESPVSQFERKAYETYETHLKSSFNRSLGRFNILLSFIWLSKSWL
jgi:hypothetical protein